MMTVKRIAVAVCPMDYVTGTRVDAGTVRVFMEDGAPGIRKEEGYVIFWDNGEPQRCLRVESPYYEPERIVICMEKFRLRRSPVLMVWLRPGASYPYPSQMRVRTGTGQPGEIINIPFEESEGILSLVGAYPADRLEPRLIQLKAPETMELEGRMLRIRRPSDGVSEYFTVWQTRNRSLGLYELTEPLREVYSIFDSAIGLVMQVRVDGRGRYLVPEPG